ncbi:MAG: YdeI/OmpD-associated family protein [Gaiellales bacterium]
MGAGPPTDLPVVSFPSQAEWAAWLDEHHADSKGVWLQIAKKGAPQATVSHQEALKAALCFGWIDGQGAPVDDTHWLQRFTPRRPRSRWSKRNTELAEQLIAAGQMRPAGLREVELARADGRWDAAYAGQRTAQVPPDLEHELASRPQARAFFESLDSANRYAILYRLAEAKRPETRARRLQKFGGMLEAGEKIHP